MVYPLHLPTGHENAVWEKIREKISENFRKFFFQDFFHFLKAVSVCFTTNTNPLLNLSLGESLLTQLTYFERLRHQIS